MRVDLWVRSGIEVMEEMVQTLLPHQLMPHTLCSLDYTNTLFLVARRTCRGGRLISHELDTWTWTCPLKMKKKTKKQAKSKISEQERGWQVRVEEGEKILLFSRDDTSSQINITPKRRWSRPPRAWHFWVRKCLIQLTITLFHIHSH